MLLVYTEAVDALVGEFSPPPDGLSESPGASLVSDVQVLSDMGPFRIESKRGQRVFLTSFL